MTINMLISFLSGVVVALFITILDGHGDRKRARETQALIEECQQDIPRDQYCKLIAVQEDKR